MNILTTRKIVFGILMTLVLAFGVQGIAEAINNPNADGVATQTVVDSTVFNVGASSSIPAITLDLDKIGTKETVSISRTSGITLTGDFYGLSSVTLTENEDTTDDTLENGNGFTYTRDSRIQTLSGTSTGAIGITFTAKGIQSVTISGRDYDNDIGNPAGNWQRKYTYYVKGPGTSTTTISLLGLRNGYKTGIFAGETHRERIHTGDSGHYDVTYETIPNSAMAQIETTAGALGGLTSLNNANTSSAFDVLLQANATYQVTARVDDSERETIGVYIIGTPTLTVGHPGDPNHDGIFTDAVSGSKGSPGRINDTLPTDNSATNRAFTASVKDGAAGNVPGVVVTFRVKGSGTAGGSLVFGAGNAGTLVDSSNRSRLDANGRQLMEDTNKTLYVRTDTNGQANVDFQLGTDRKQDVTISAVGQSKVVSAYAGTAASGNQLVEPRSQSSQVGGRSGEYELRVKAEDADGDALPNQYVEFRTSDGILDDPSTVTAPTDIGRLAVMTDTQGTAFVFFDPKDSSGSLRVTAHLLDIGADTTVSTADDRVIDDVVFNVRGRSNDDGDPDPPPVATRGSLNISLSGSGNTRTVTVTALNPGGTAASGISVLLNVNNGATLSRTSGPSPLTSTLTLPGTAGDYTLSATTTADYTGDSETITITSPGTLSLQEVGARAANGGQSIRVTVREADGTLASGTVRVTLSGAASRIVDATNGTGAASLTLPTTGGSHTVTLSATGYRTSQHTFSTAGQQTGDPSQPTTGTAGAADSIEIDGSRQLSRNVNQATPLRVRVVDVNNRGVSDVRVTFRVLAPGQGRLSQRGNGRAVQVNTDRNGYASASLTPLGGDVIVEAKAAGVSASVTFIIDVSGTTTTPTPTPTPSTDAPSSQMINPEDAEVHVGAAQRSPMLWVDGGAIYALVDADVQRFAPSVENALHITVGGSKVYWTAQTGTSSGTINSANLDGSGVTELKSIMAVPIGIAVDTDASQLYWTNSRGRIQSANLNGSSVTNELQNLEGAKDIAVARGLVYWTQFDATMGQGRLGIMNPNAGQNGTRYISTGSDSPMSLTINGNKVYWTEQTGVSSGTINSANLNGSGVKQLASIRAVPSGIGVDMARSHLYWTNSRGRIQRADLDGKQIQNVADGLGSPGDMVLSNSIPTPTAVTSTTPTPTPTADNAQYDVNGDGLVNNTDASLVAGAMNTSHTKYDVNGDGTVNFLDLLLVFDNRDAGAASAPTVVGMQLSAVQVDVLQEQIDLLIATNDRSPSAMRTLIYLQQLLATARPEQTQLLANYPNPFNPETWIPYELATDTNVTLTIYNAQGVVVRSLILGHQRTGYYVGRDRAAYWDGRNAFGEQVASGIYFYQLETDAMSLMRKMVILK